MNIRMVLSCDLGQYKSEIMEVDIDQYKQLIEVSKEFYKGGFEMYLENGFVIVPPEIVKKSILLIEVLENV